MLTRIQCLIRNLTRKPQRDAELDAEVRAYESMLAEEKVRSGMQPEEARRSARLELGGVEQVKQQVREARAGAWLDSLFQDLRYGARMLRKSPGFTTVAVLTLALGIGANTAVFSLIDAVLLRALAVAHPYELVLFSDSPNGGSASGTQTGHWTFFSSDDYRYFREHRESFKALCAFQSGWNDLRIRVAGTSGRPDGAHGRLVSGDFFSFLGLSASAGRLFTLDDDQAGAPPAVVLNYAYWARTFHADPSILGKNLEINGMTFTVIGVAPRTFPGVKYDHPDLWLPLVFQPQITSERDYARDPQAYWLNIMARLKSGVTLKQAQTVVNAQLKQVLTTQAKPETAQEIANSYIQLAPGAYGISFFRSLYSETLRVLAAIVVIVLLIACANVANLLLSRSSARQQEISIRVSLGASRGRLLRQLFTESLLLAVLGGALGILGARWGVQLLTSLILRSPEVKASVDARALVFTAAVSILSGILFGLVPALRSSRADLNARVKGSATRLQLGVANALVILQIAACVVLLIGAGLFLRTLSKLASQELGFDDDHLLVARIHPQEAGYDLPETPTLYQALIDRVEAIPGIVSATVALEEPFSGSSSFSSFSIEGEPPRQEMMLRKELVGPSYFETMGIPILLGRDISPQDRPGSALVTVINQSLAREFFPRVNPIGKRISLDSPFNAEEAMMIVGVAADARYYSLREPVPPMEFCAAFQVPDKKSYAGGYAQALELRVRGNPAAIATEIRPALAEVSASLPVTRINLLKQEVNNSLWQNRSAAQLSSVFGALALLLACIGVYGTTAHRVSRRTQEIGIRMALGAQPSGVLWLITKECLVLVAIGLGIGASAAFGTTRMIASQLFEVRPNDPLTFTSVALLLCAVALTASYVPSRRAMRVDPVVALRHE